MAFPVNINLTLSASGAPAQLQVSDTAYRVDFPDVDNSDITPKGKADRPWWTTWINQVYRSGQTPATHPLGRVNITTLGTGVSAETPQAVQDLQFYYPSPKTSFGISVGLPPVTHDNYNFLRFYVRLVTDPTNVYDSSKTWLDNSITTGDQRPDPGPPQETTGSTVTEFWS